MRHTIRLAFSLAAGLGMAATSANAQYKQYPVSDPATGEKYVVEAAFGFWNPDPTLTISSEALGIIGSEIDAVADLGMTQTRFQEFRFVLRPGKKHKFRFDYVPILYEAEVTLKREVVFNGNRYEVGLPVNSKLDWRAMRLGYEYDFLYKDRWYVGVLVEAKYTDVRVDLATPLREADFAEARAPIPAIGGIARVYPVSNISVTFDLSAFKLPVSVDKENRYDGKILDWDLYGTINVTNNFGGIVGYRSMNVYYRVKNDTGDMRLGGLYFMGVARF
jgi:hypothetical protein